jgi:hypothetical protein
MPRRRYSGVYGVGIGRTLRRLFSHDHQRESIVSATNLVVWNHIRFWCRGRHDSGLVRGGRLMRRGGRDGDAVLPNSSAAMWCNRNQGDTNKCFEVGGRMNDGLGPVV